MQKLKILFDARWLVSGPPSGASVVQGLITGWKQSHPQDKITLQVPRGTRKSTIDAKLGFTDYTLEPQKISVTNHAFGILATKSTMAYDVYFSQNFGAPLSASMNCVFVHDAIYVDHPKWFSRKEKLYLSLIRPSLFRSKVIFTSSESESIRLRRVWPALKNRIKPIGLALPTWVQANVDLKPWFDKPYSPFILTVGRLNVRKNLRRLIEAFSYSAAKDTHTLVIVGNPDGLADLPKEQQLSIVFAQGVENNELKWLYNNADAFVFPSLDEGFGLPLIEASAFGVPACASKIPAFEELNIASHYFDPYSTDSIARALDATISIAKRPASTPDQYSWSCVVEKARTEILQVIGKPRTTTC